MLKKGQKSNEVKQLQMLLTEAGVPTSADGDFGPKTEKAVKRFQSLNGLEADGVADAATMEKLREVAEDRKTRMTFPLYLPELYANRDNFIYFVGGGHGGVDDKGKYTTGGKRAYHEGLQLHKDGHYYEGYENRIIAEATAYAAQRAGLNVVRVHEPYADNSLGSRVKKIQAYLRRGFCGYYQSFHSNAISESKNSAAQLRNTRGLGIYTTRGETMSDKVANKYMELAEEIFEGTGWRLRRKKDEGEKVLDGDREANFYVLRHTDLDEFEGRFASTLEEFGFHTSSLDCEFITSTEIRKKRVELNVKVALWIRSQFFAER